MTALKTILVAALSCAAGFLIQLGVTGVSQRQAQAAFDSPSGDFTQAALGAGAPGGQIVAPGGNFVTNVYKQVSPSVVHITNRTETVVGFDIFRGPVRGESEAVGSGVIVDSSGYILTNSHVASNPNATKKDTLTVVLSDQTQYPGTLVGNDPSTDLALIKIDAPRALPAVTFGDSNNVEIGEWVVAIGNPRGYDWTVTAGVVSAKNRSGPAWERNGTYGPTITGLIQTDAAINPGNSGGPLLNARGEVIGINERIISSSQGNEGIGLAIPSNTANGVWAELRKHGRVERSWLGLNVMREINPEYAQRNNFPIKQGLLIGQIIESSPAHKAGIVQAFSNGRTYEFDIISDVDGKVLKSQQDLLDVVRNRKPGQTVKLHLFRVRNGRTSESDVSVTLSAVPAEADMSGYI